MLDDTIRLALLLHQRWLDGESDGARADVSGTDFLGEDLSAWDFRRIVARGCNFTGARMPVRMQGGDFVGSIFANAFMDRSNVEECDFSSADFRGASMYYTVVLNNAVITGARFSDNVILWLLDIMLGIDFSESSSAIQAMVEGLRSAREAMS